MQGQIRREFVEREVERERAMLEGSELLNRPCQSHPEMGGKGRRGGGGVRPGGFTEPSEAED